MRIVIALLLLLTIPAQATKPKHQDKWYRMASAKEQAQTRRMSQQIDAQLNRKIWPRDIFHCLKKYSCNKPIRGWRLKAIRSYTIDASVDQEDGTFEATHPGRKTQYFWFHIKMGVDNKTGISLSSTEVKQLDNKDQDPHHNYNDDLGFWSPDREYQWIPTTYDPTIGVCADRPHSDMAWSSFPTSKQECFDSGKNKKCMGEGDDGKWKDEPCSPYKEEE